MTAKTTTKSRATRQFEELCTTTLLALDSTQTWEVVKIGQNGIGIRFMVMPIADDITIVQLKRVDRAISSLHIRIDFSYRQDEETGHMILTADTWIPRYEIMGGVSKRALSLYSKAKEWQKITWE